MIESVLLFQFLSFVGLVALICVASVYTWYTHDDLS